MRSYPVETLLALYACIRCLLTYELDWSEEELFNRLGLVPLFFALALAVNNLAGRGPWRKVYWVVWAPIVPLTLWSGLGDWIESASFRISLGILAPLLLLLSLRAVRNDRFVNGALVWLRSGALALLFANQRDTVAQLHVRHLRHVDHGLIHADAPGDRNAMASYEDMSDS